MLWRHGHGVRLWYLIIGQKDKYSNASKSAGLCNLKVANPKVPHDGAELEAANKGQFGTLVHTTTKSLHSSSPQEDMSQP